ncbi:MAG: hypothetical protein JXA21_01175 [Anaerolineae bacterium]|nr:hypothetical protein [Anaerolineae bacterium]
METRKNLLQVVEDWLVERRASAPTASIQPRSASAILRWFLPNGGTLLLIALLIATQSLWARPAAAPNAPDASTTTVNYQGRLADSSGTPINDTLSMQFSLFDSAVGGVRLWGPETHATVSVADGLFSAGLGSQTSGGIPTNILSGDLWLEIVVDTETLSPREQLRAVPYAMQASVALTVPDGSITPSKLNLDTAVDFQGNALTNVADITSGDIDDFIVTNPYGRVRMRSADDFWVFIDTDNNQNDAVFRIYHDNDHSASPVETLLVLDESGNLTVIGSISQGAMIENNLQTSEELAMKHNDHFSEGDVLCWGEDRLELCAQQGDPFVQAIADANGKPIVMGAEVVKVVGPVQRGDLLVASNVPGYAIAVTDPAPGAVIAQALADFDDDRGVVKAMIRKF